jgi:hypothetical protein
VVVSGGAAAKLFKLSFCDLVTGPESTATCHQYNSLGYCWWGPRGGEGEGHVKCVRATDT